MELTLDDPCPFCAGFIAFGAKPNPFAAHTFPHCKKFADLTVIEFLHAVNMAYGLKKEEIQS